MMPNPYEQAQSPYSAEPTEPMPQQSPNMYYNASTMYSDQQFESVMKTILGDEDLLNSMEHQFKGEVLEVDKDDNTRWVKKQSAIIKNEDAIPEILQILRFMGLNKITKITMLTERNINIKMEIFEYKLAELLYMNRKKWGIEKCELSMLYNMIWNLVENSLLIAKDGRLLETLRTTYQRSEHENVAPQQGGSGWGMLKGYMQGNPHSRM